MHKIICETYGENVKAIRTCANWYKRFKNDDFDISDKERSGHLVSVEEGKLQKDGKKLWKTIENTSNNLYCINFFYFNKKL